MRKIVSLRSFLISLTLIMTLVAGAVFAGHNGAAVDVATAACGETTVTATITDPSGTHKVSNMYLVVDANGVTQSGNIPIDGSNIALSVGPFFTQSVENVTVSWNVFGGGERSYDQPPWNGFGQPGFSAAVNDYASQQGGFSWVLDGPDDPNPFVNWNEVNVQSCAITKEMCMGGGWADLGFSNQGQCIRYVNTGMDSR